MLDDIPVIDVHQHVVPVASLKMPWERWAPPGVTGLRRDEIYRPDGTVDPAGYVGHLDDHGIDVALLMAEYSPRVTGLQTIEDMVPLRDAAPDRIGLIAAINPHLHFPPEAELDRQLALGAVALKLHPVHGDHAVDRADLYPAYARCQDAGLPVVIHCGTSNFAGAANARADPTPLLQVVRDFPELDVVLAHGGRGWFYDQAAWMALTYAHVWIELSGLPPHRLPDYYRSVGFERLAPRCIFGTDFPAIPGLRENAKAVAELGLPRDVLERVLWRNAVDVYRLDSTPGLTARLPV
ncbi:MAG TPA: amidohydrolase family protein [Euzebyales bacterium]